MRAPLLATLALTTSAKLSPEWRVVAENRGVVTRARIDEASQLCAVHGEAVVELSMAELMTVFLDLEQYDKWDDTLVEKRQWRADGADFIYQRFQQPWPVRDRELVLKMTTYPYPDENRLAVRWAGCDPARTVFIEDESHNVGRCGVPRGLWRRMRAERAAVPRGERAHHRGPLVLRAHRGH